MKRYFFLLLVFFSLNAFSQSSDYEKYYYQIMQKAEKLGTDMRKEWERTTNSAMQPHKKEVYALYIDGKKAACFADEFACKGQINALKSKMENLMNSAISGMPNDVRKSYGTQMQADIKKYVNNINCLCKKESNPNYDFSANTTAGNGVNTFDLNSPTNTKNTNGNAVEQTNILGKSSHVTNPLEPTIKSQDKTSVSQTTTVPVNLSAIPDNVFGDDKFNNPNSTEIKIVAGENVTDLSIGILTHFRNNGIDNSFASKEIERILTKKYGMPLGLLSPEKQAEYVKDYNELSKAVEDDVKMRHEEDMKNKNLTSLNDFEKYNSSLIDKRKALLIEADEWELRDKVYSITAAPSFPNEDRKRLEEAKETFLKASVELGVSEEDAIKKMNEIVTEMQDESFQRNAPRQQGIADKADDSYQSGEAGYQLGISSKNAYREWELANQKHSLRNEAQTLSQNIESNDKLIEQIKNNDFESENIKISENIANGCGTGEAGIFEKTATKTGQSLDYLLNGFQSQANSCDQHDIDYYNGVPKELADNDFQQRSPIMGTAVKMAKETSQNAYNSSQQQRLIDETLMQMEFNKQVQRFNIQGISESPKIEDGNLKYFQDAINNGGVININPK